MNIALILILLMYFAIVFGLHFKTYVFDFDNIDISNRWKVFKLSLFAPILFLIMIVCSLFYFDSEFFKTIVYHPYVTLLTIFLLSLKNDEKLNMKTTYNQVNELTYNILIDQK